MDAATDTRTDASPLPHRRVRIDLAAGAALLAIVIGGNLIRHASDAGIISALAGR